MNLRTNKIVLTIFCVLLFVNFSCENNDEEAGYRNIPKETYKRNIYTSLAIWDEVVYKTSDPRDYKLYHYEVISDTIDASHIKNAVYCNSEKIGYVSIDDSGLVQYMDLSLSNKQLLYDFGALESQFDGVVARYFEPKMRTKFLYYNEIGVITNDTPLPTLATIRTILCWKNDKSGSLISGIGSTEGVFSPIFGPAENGYSRAVLQCYTLSEKELLIPIRDSIGFSQILQQEYPIKNLLYDNQDTPVNPYIQREFWIQDLTDISDYFSGMFYYLI